MSRDEVDEHVDNRFKAMKNTIEYMLHLHIKAKLAKVLASFLSYGFSVLYDVGFYIQKSHQQLCDTHLIVEKIPPTL